MGLFGNSADDEFDPYKNIREPKVNIDDVILSTEVKNRIMRNFIPVTYKNNNYKISQILEKGKGTLLLFIGGSGTGKTMMAEGIANNLKMNYILIGSGDIETRVPGQYERNVKTTLEFAEQNKCIVIFDECESIISSRSNADDEMYKSDIKNAQINAVLGYLEQFNGIAIFTSNRPFSIDPAMRRRFRDIITFPHPTKEQQKSMWKNYLMQIVEVEKENNHNDFIKDLALSNMPQEVRLKSYGTELKLVDSKIDVDKLVEIYDVAGGGIKQIILNSITQANYESCELTTDHIIKECEMFTNSMDDMNTDMLKEWKYNHNEPNVLKALGLKDDDIKTALHSIKDKLKLADKPSKFVEIITGLSKTERLCFNTFIVMQSSEALENLKKKDDINTNTITKKEVSYCG